MEELLFQVLAGIGEVLLETFFYVLVEAILDVASRATALLLTNIVKTARNGNRALVVSGYALLGLLLGGLSVLIFPYPLIHREHPSRFHGISLVAAPVITGLVMSLIGSIFRRTGKRAVQIESFGCGFAFALGMALVRFFFTK